MDSVFVCGEMSKTLFMKPPRSALAYLDSLHPSEMKAETRECVIEKNEQR